MSGLLFITSRCGFKTVNDLLLCLRDDEFGAGDQMHVVLSRSATDLDQTGYRENLPATAAGSLTLENFERLNEWADESVKNVEGFILHEAAQSESGSEPALFLVLDEEGVRNKTVIVTQRNMYWLHEEYGERDEDGNVIPRPRHDFNKVRLPWDDAYVCFCNLHIANMNFEEFCDEAAGPDQDGWWKT